MKNTTKGEETRRKYEFLNALRIKARDDLTTFAKLTKPDYKAAPHLKFLASHLQSVEAGKITRLLITIPPRHGKSELCSIRFPAFYLGKNPEKRIILASYGAELSFYFSKRVRDLVASPFYKIIFPKVTLSDSSQAKHNWELSDGGGMLATAVDGAATGYGANLFIIDDPIKDRLQANSKTYRGKCYDWYRQVVETRLEPNSAIVLIMTRWHEDDLAGRLLAEERDKWTVINLPIIAQRDDLLGREEGELLWASRFTRKEIEHKLKALGSYAASALYFGRPTPEGGQLVKKDWIKWYDGTLPPSVNWYGGIDTATSMKENSDFSSLCEVAVDSQGFIYVHDVSLDKLSVFALANYVLSRHSVLSFSKVNIETNNAGDAIRQRIEELGREKKIYLPLVGVRAVTDKMARLLPLTPLIENGTIRFNRKSSRVVDMVDRLATMPYANIDDDIDSFVWAVQAVKENNVGDAFLEFMKQDVEKRIINWQYLATC